MKKILCALLGMILTLPVFAACPSGQVEQTYTSATGTVTQNGTPTPTNPIEPIFYQQGNMVLRKVGDIADSYDATTGKITRRVGVKVFNGTENFTNPFSNGRYVFYMPSVKNYGVGASDALYCSHFKADTYSTTGLVQGCGWYTNAGEAPQLRIMYPDITELSAFKSYLAEQYNAGTPVTVYYPLATETTEDWNETTYCINQIKIATTAYNSARFSPVVTDLNDTIATIRSVVTNTINQTKAIADLQATKQTRPNETCPAGKKCLLVEDNDGQPHWYEIIENAYGLPSGYTGLEYLQSTGTQWIDTGIVPNADLMVEYTFQRVSSTGLAIWFGSSNGTGADYPTDTQFWTESNSWNIANCVPTGITPSSANGHRCVINGLDKNKHTVTFNRISDGKVLWDGSVIGAYLPYETSNNKSMYLGISNHPALGTYNKFTQNIYGARFTNKSTGNLVANFVPAKNSSGVIGMYDTVSGQFFTNAGTGTFVAGPVVQ